ncbi:MAG: hypothetical protein ACI9VR_003325 [Cognaticolwellia sp.]
MARLDRLDRTLSLQLDELEQSLFLLKIQYDKYFNGVELTEPVRYRDDAQRTVRVLLRETITNTRQRFRFQQLRARFNTIDLYLRRNLVQIERGTHPKFKFRADLKERNRAKAASRMEAARADTRSKAEKSRKEDAAFRQIYDRYMDARKKCGQSTDMEYGAMQRALRAQVKNIKSRYECDRVSFRIQVEGGKAKLKAMPKSKR